MEQFSIFGLMLSCLALPLILLLLVGFAYALGIGGIKLPGVTRSVSASDKDWSTVSEAVRNTGKAIAAIIGLIGGLFGILGFLLPWANLDLSGSGVLSVVVSGFKGSMTGIALALQSLVGSFLLIASKEEGMIVIGILLLILSLFIWLVAITVLATTILSLRIILVPLGLSKRDNSPLARLLIVVGTTSLCLSLVFLAFMQATVGGIQMGAQGIGLSFEVGSGFWITLGGLLLSVVGAWMAYILTEKLAEWTAKLTHL